MMPRPSTSTKVPKAMETHYRVFSELTDAFCREHLDEEYAGLARLAVAALCRKRPSPLLSGKPNTWACGVVYALGQVNFLSDKSTRPHMGMEELCARFGVAATTGCNKAKAVRDALDIYHGDHRWILPSRMDANPMVWSLEVDGLMVDIRRLPRPVQVHAFERGLIPYVPADRDCTAGNGRSQTAEGKRYDRYRKINKEHQTQIANRQLFGPVADHAVDLGLIDSLEDLAVMDPDQLAPAFDLALYGAGEDGESEVRRHAHEMRDMVSATEERVLAAMCEAKFSIFRVIERHPTAGAWLSDLANGETVWVMDRGLDASVAPGVDLALRLFRPDEFWMTTGVCVVVDGENVWQLLQRRGLAVREGELVEAGDRDRLASTIYRLAIDPDALDDMNGRQGISQTVEGRELVV